MARLLSRFIGLISLTAALTYFIYDGARSFMNQTVQISSVGSTWENIPKSWLAWLQPVIERALSRFCNGGSTAFFNSATVFSRSPTRL